MQRTVHDPQEVLQALSVVRGLLSHIPSRIHRVQLGEVSSQVLCVHILHDRGHVDSIKTAFFPEHSPSEAQLGQSGFRS